jgi:hypothetical protein
MSEKAYRIDKKKYPIPDPLCQRKYPTTLLKVGESYTLEASYATLDNIRKTAANVGIKIATRSLGNGTHRIWRLT